jgi:hypothetical protein
MKTFKEFVKMQEKMTITTINWKQVTFSDTVDLSHNFDFYLFYRGTNILYIGKSFKQHVSDEINQTIRAFQLNTTGLGLFVGMLNLEKSDAQRRSDQLITDMECLLINYNQPSYNTQCKKNYTGRDNLKVKNMNCKLLEICIVSDGNKSNKCK